MMLVMAKSSHMLPKVLTNICQRITSGLLSTPSCAAIAHPQLRHYDTLYQSETCEDCAEAYPKLPLRTDLKKIKKPDRTKIPKACWHALRRTEYKCRTDPEFSVSSFINHNKECVTDPCADAMPLADLTHYRPSDKLNRKYQRTWVECVLKKRKIKAHCYFKPIPKKRRQRKLYSKKNSCESNPCALGAPDLKLQSCLEKTDLACPRFRLPNCKASRYPPKCKKLIRKPSSCYRRLTKYPSFSECLIDPLPDLPPNECDCLKTPSMCSVWEYYRNKKS